MIVLQLPKNLAEQLYHELESAGSREIGGILMGEQIVPGKFRVMEMTFQRHGGLIAKFIRNAHIAFLSLQRFFTRTGNRYHQFNYLGEWHSHPSFEVRPSMKDHESMIEIACNPHTGANFVVLMIVRLDGEKQIDVSVTTYLPDGTASESKLLIGNTDDL